MNAPDTIEHLRQRLNQCEHALQRCERLALASRYASAVMHEVNNPLAAITNLVFLTKLQANEPERVLQNMGVIESQLKALGKVTGRVLAFHRDRSEPSDTDLIEIVESALKLHSDRMTAGNVVLRKDLGGPASARVFASDILQVLSNLLLNALDALPSKGACLIVRVRARPDAIHIAVADNGSGIPSHIKKTLFEPYTTSKQTGTGLGLWLSRLIVNKHGGRLRVRSSQGEGRRGTTFRLSLPIGPADIRNSHDLFPGRMSEINRSSS